MFDIGDAFFGDLGDVDHPRFTGSEVDDCTDSFEDFSDLPSVGFTWFDIFEELGDKLDGSFSILLIFGGDTHHSFIGDINLDTIILGDFLDHFPTFSDHFADTVNRDHHREDEWCVWREIRSWSGELLSHLSADVGEGSFCLFEYFLEDSYLKTLDFTIHLESRDSFVRSSDLEVEIPEEIFLGLDI